MVFCSAIFLFVFLPLVLAMHIALPSVRARNLLLLLVSLFFYAWGEVRFVWVMLLSTAMNYSFALFLDRSQSDQAKKGWLALAIAGNLGLLFYFKYAGFFVDNLDWLLATTGKQAIEFHPPALPLGISFFTFHALSYVIDIYRKQAVAQRDYLKLALYISFFPQLVAGPIVRYHEISDQLSVRFANLDNFAKGIQRFVFGLGKKMLIANTVAVTCDQIFALPNAQITPELAWLAAICYTLQIYFDFSGYSDMAIGLALMFGFKFPENFNYPYVSKSIREFWQRWHMSLSNWFRDYLYIPLGGNRKGTTRTVINLITVFLLCGLWHGASWTFIVWGLYHGFFLGAERIGLEKLIAKLPPFLRHAYAMLVVIFGWVCFRSFTFEQASCFIKAMCGQPATEAWVYNAGYLLNGKLLTAIVFGVLISTPIVPYLQGKFEQSKLAKLRPVTPIFVSGLRHSMTCGVLLFSIMQIASSSYNPFIYFRF